MKFGSVALAIFAVPFCSVLAVGQGDPVAMAKAASANQLGVLEYCQAQGDVDPAAITAQKADMARLPSTSAAVPTDTAEALGKQGTISVNGNTMTLAGMASSHNTTVDAICKQMGSSATQAAAAFAQHAIDAEHVERDANDAQYAVHGIHGRHAGHARCCARPLGATFRSRHPALG